MPLQNLLDANRRWAANMESLEPGYFNRLAQQQTPEYLWIGCSDSRVPANQVTGLQPGEVFVHRNVANLVVQTDFNCLSVMQFAVEALKVKHILVVGHYGCGGVRAALDNRRLGLIDNWLRQVQNVAAKHRAQLDAIDDRDARANRLCELNVMEQVINVGRTTIVTDAWSRGQSLAVHGWIYGLQDGIIKDLGVTLQAPADLNTAFERARTGAL